MNMKLSEATQILERTPGLLSHMLVGLSDEWLQATEGANTWSSYQVVGHLIHGEKTDWLPRVRIIVEHGESRAFEPFDRFAQLKEPNTEPIAVLLDHFRQLREWNLAALRSMALPPEALSRTGVHPALGIVTLQQLIATWAVHDLTHIAQITRVLAKQYEVEVGPWKAYLGVLNR